MHAHTQAASMQTAAAGTPCSMTVMGGFVSYGKLTPCSPFKWSWNNLNFLTLLSSYTCLYFQEAPQELFQARLPTHRSLLSHSCWRQQRVHRKPGCLVQIWPPSSAGLQTQRLWTCNGTFQVVLCWALGNIIILRRHFLWNYARD